MQAPLQEADGVERLRRRRRRRGGRFGLHHDGLEDFRRGCLVAAFLLPATARRLEAAVYIGELEVTMHRKVSQAPQGRRARAWLGCGARRCHG
jgi:hypothetical protein